MRVPKHNHEFESKVTHQDMIPKKASKISIITRDQIEKAEKRLEEDANEVNNNQENAQHVVDLDFFHDLTDNDEDDDDDSNGPSDENDEYEPIRDEINDTVDHVQEISVDQDDGPDDDADDFLNEEDFDDGCMDDSKRLA